MLEEDSTLRGLEVDLFWACYLSHIWVASKTAQEAPKRPQDPPKSAPRGSKRPPRAPQEAPRGPQETPRAAQEGSRPSKITPKDSKRTLSATQLRISVLRLEKHTIPKTIVHINVADVAEIDKDKTLLTRGAVVYKGRAGGGVPPWGRQFAATLRVGVCWDGL